jgi:hypothetical protein
MIPKAMFAAVAAAVLATSGVAAPDAEKAFHAARYGDVAPLVAALPHIRDRPLAALAKAEIAAARMDAAGVRTALAAYRATSDRDSRRRARMLSLAASVAFARGDYAAAADDAARWRAALGDSGDRHDIDDADQLRTLAKLLAAAPRMAVTARAPAPIATERDAAGLVRATALIDGMPQSSVLDTGANLSTVSASAAARLHLHMLDGSASVGSATRDAVPVRIGIADEVRLAGFTFRNVPFLVLDDAALRIPLPGGYSIDAIIGFPIFRDMGSITFAEGRFTPALPADPARSSPLRMQESDLFVALQIGPDPVALQLDTGALATALSVEFAHDHPALVARLPRSDQHVAGAAGTGALRVAYWADVPVRIGGGAARLDRVPIMLSNPGDTDRKNYGAIGQDLLRRFTAYTIDFRTMRFSVTP